MSFAYDIKQEVLSQEFSEEQAYAFVQGVASTAGIRDGSKTVVRLNNESISNVFRHMLDQMNIKHETVKENKNWVKISEEVRVDKITMPSHYFAGAFVGGGSISDPSSTSYHLEIQLYSSTEAGKIQMFLNKYSFEFTKIQRRKLWVLYIKKSEQISDFLKAIQAFNALMAFEDARITRDFQNQLNRYSNLDTYNQQKLVDSNAEFKELWKEVNQYGLESEFREVELNFFKLKANNPYSSLEELKDMMNEKYSLNKTRAGLNHWIIKLRKVTSEREK